MEKRSPALCFKTTAIMHTIFKSGEQRSDTASDGKKLQMILPILLILYTDNVQDDATFHFGCSCGAMTEDIKPKVGFLFSNIVGANDTNMLSNNYSGPVGTINKRINVVQTDYAELAAKYLKSKKYR